MSRTHPHLGEKPTDWQARLAAALQRHRTASAAVANHPADDDALDPLLAEEDAAWRAYEAIRAEPEPT